MVYEWKDQVVLITGAATGIGAEVVKILVEEGVKHIAILDVDEAAGVKFRNELNAKFKENIVKFYTCDVTNEELFIGIIKSVKDEQGYIDVVINNAGIMNDRPDVFKKEIDINLTALVTGTLQAIEHMRKDKGGRGGSVINISSIVALVQSHLTPIYNATKSAVLQFSNCIGMDEYYSRTGVRVLAVCFGVTKTPLVTAQKLGSFDAEYEDKMIKIVEGHHTYQSPEHAAKGLVDVYKRGESGTTWLVNASKPAQDISSDIRKGYEMFSTKYRS